AGHGTRVSEQKKSPVGAPGRLSYAAAGSAAGAGVGSAWAAGRAGLVTPAKKRSAMIHMLWLIGHGGKELLVPKVGRWLMKMPHGYTLVGEGRAGVKIEPPRGQVAPRADNPYAGDHFEHNQPTLSVPNLEEHDTQGVLALTVCERRSVATGTSYKFFQVCYAMIHDRHPWNRARPFPALH